VDASGVRNQERLIPATGNVAGIGLSSFLGAEITRFDPMVALRYE